MAAKAGDPVKCPVCGRSDLVLKRPALGDKLVVEGHRDPQGQPCAGAGKPVGMSSSLIGAVVMSSVLVETSPGRRVYAPLGSPAAGEALAGY